MKPTTTSLLAAVAALGAVTALAAVTAPGTPVTTVETKLTPRLPVERSNLLCPAPSNAEVAETTYTSFTPKPSGPPHSTQAAKGTAELRPGTVQLVATATETTKKPDGGTGKPVLSLTAPGKPAAATVNGSDAPALVGQADGHLAPGWTAQATTAVTAGDARGLLGTACTGPDTEAWFPGASTAEGRRDYVHLTNPDDTHSVVDIELYGKDGQLKTTLTDGLSVPARGSAPVLLSTLTTEALPDLTVRVTTRSGRVGAVVRTAEDAVGSDWLAASADPSATAVLPGIPADATSVRLVLFAPGEADAELKVQLAAPGGSLVPAGHETVRVKSGMTTTVDLADVTKGEPGSLLLTPAHKDLATPVVAALRVVRGTKAAQEVAFIPAAEPVGDRASVADNRAQGTTLALTAPTATGKVRVTASTGTGGGEPTVATYTVKAGTTLSFAPPAPAGLTGSYGLTVETVSGGPVHAARTLALPRGGVQMFTVQTLRDDRSTVAVPEVERDLSVLDD
ncbi:DUF5719 family protein [Streptomyces sp. NPDC048057]|uniref:DUF5719 family protein n=1 Tax=Streptomyces sp. NPDC048057 TaxID=3155628 RepID=UPI0033F00886